MEPIGPIMPPPLPIPSNIFTAAYYGDAKKVKELMESDPSKVNEPWGNGATPLLIATRRGHEEVAKMLLSY